MIFFDRQDRPFLIDGPDTYRFASECHEAPLVPEPPLTRLHVRVRGTGTPDLVCTVCGCYALTRDGEPIPSTDRPDVDAEYVRDLVNTI